MKKLKFIQLLTGQMTGASSTTSPYNFGSWSILYALADDGTVWMWSGAGGVGWVQCGPNPADGLGDDKEKP